MSVGFDIGDTFSSIGNEFSDVFKGVGRTASELLDPITGNKAAKAAIRAQSALDQKNIANFTKEKNEELRRLALENSRNESSVINNIGGSGFASGGSLDSYLYALQDEQMANIKWMSEAGASQIDIMGAESEARRRNADAARKQNNVSSVGGLVGAGLSLFG